MLSNHTTSQLNNHSAESTQISTLISHLKRNVLFESVTMKREEFAVREDIFNQLEKCNTFNEVKTVCMNCRQLKSKSHNLDSFINVAVNATSLNDLQHNLPFLQAAQARREPSMFPAAPQVIQTPQILQTHQVQLPEIIKCFERMLINEGMDAHYRVCAQGQHVCIRESTANPPDIALKNKLNSMMTFLVNVRAMTFAQTTLEVVDQLNRVSSCPAIEIQNIDFFKIKQFDMKVDFRNIRNNNLPNNDMGEDAHHTKPYK